MTGNQRGLLTSTGGELALLCGVASFFSAEICLFAFLRWSRIAVVIVLVAGLVFDGGDDENRSIAYSYLVTLASNTTVR